MKINNNTNSIMWIVLFLILLCPFSIFAADDLSVSSADNLEQSETTPTDPFVASLELLNERSFKKKAQAVEQLLSIDDPRIIKTFKYLLKGNLYYRKEDKLIAYLDKADDEYIATEVVSGNPLGKIEKSDFKKIIANNKMRRQVRTAIALLSLGNKDPSIRLSAVREMLSKPTSEGADLVRKLINKESDTDVKDAMATLIALTDLNSDDKTMAT